MKGSGVRYLEARPKKEEEEDTPCCSDCEMPVRGIGKAGGADRGILGQSEEYMGGGGHLTCHQH